MFWIVLMLAQAAVTQQVDRGEALFFGTANGCSSCHLLKGRGAAVGPDLKGIGRLTPAAIVMAIHSTATQYVQDVRLKSKETFPAMPGAKDEKIIQLYDLSKTPPELRKTDLADIESMTNTSHWKHPPAVNKHTAEQLADIVAYVRYAATGTRKAVDPSEVQ
ncbi:MAG: cytochrome c [Bryobacteraceae bacterium]|jgi:mono/diheme cytochrome c family protein